MNNQIVATVHDNRVNRVAAMLDTARPWVVKKPAGFINPILGHYASKASAQKAAKHFNERVN